MSPLLIDNRPVELTDDNFDKILRAMDIPNITPDTPFAIDKSVSGLKHQCMRIVPHTVAVAYYRGVITAVAAVDTVLYMHALGGRYETRSLRPHRVEHIVVNGVNMRCGLTVRAGTAFCGPIWCAPRRRDDLLSTLPWTAMRGGARWCTPIDRHGKPRCGACSAVFTRATDLFEHGGVPRVQYESFSSPRYLIPPHFRPLPPAVNPAPVSRSNLAQGSLNDRYLGQRRTSALRTRLGRLQQRHGGRYVPYVVRRVYR